MSDTKTTKDHLSNAEVFQCRENASLNRLDASEALDRATEELAAWDAEIWKRGLQHVRR